MSGPGIIIYSHKPVPRWNQTVTKHRSEDGTGWLVEEFRDQFIEEQMVPNVYESADWWMTEYYYGDA